MMLPDDVTIYLYADITDMRKSINTLAILVQEEMGKSPNDGSLYLFRSRCAKKMKALYYEDSSFTLWYRRLERGRFIFPRNAEGSIELSKSHFEWLLASNRYTHLKQESADIYMDFC